MSSNSQVIYIGRPKKIPLVISPNLDALLEHDERTRPRRVVSPTPDALLSSATSSSTGSFIGLPPPPRGPRKTSSVQWPAAVDERIVLRPELSITPTRPSPSGNTTTPNPFINPAPSLETLLEAKAAVIPPVEDVAATADADSADTTPLLLSSISITADDTMITSSSLKRTNSRAHQKGPKRRTIHNDNADVQLSSGSGYYRQSEKPSTRKRDKTKTKGNHSSAAADIITTVDKAIRSRPFFSHENETRTSLSSTSSDNTTTTSCCPPSTTADEFRISISSTIYQSPPTHIPSSLLDRESFIEFASPTRSTFSTTTTSASSASASSSSSDTHRRHPIEVMDLDVDRPASRTDTLKSTMTTTMTTTTTTKPPRPTTPKPDFGRVSPQLKASVLPPTTNLLNPEDRADLIKRNRKIAQVFGKNPGPDVLAKQPSNRYSQHRNAHSVAVDPADAAQQSYNVSKKDALYAVDSQRPRSTPPNPDNVAKWHQSSSSSVNTSAGSVEKLSHNGRSVTSFIDLSDDDSRSRRRPSEATSSSSLSVYENMSEEERLEEERRRKREKLTKLHRFLGSRVPTNLVLGLADVESPFPSPGTRGDGLVVAVDNNYTVPDADARLPFLRRRRSSSVVALPSTWSDDIDRLKEDLDEREKAVNVRRAVKMEKVFGVQPPQTLYHTRHSPSPSVPLGTGVVTPAKPTTFLNRATSFTPPFDRKDQATSSKPRGGNQQSLSERLSAYNYTNSDWTLAISPLSPPPPPPPPSSTSPPLTSGRGNSDVYTHYQHSLNSLHDIINRDDKLSLAELHEYLHTETLETIEEPPSQYISSYTAAAAATATTPTKADRRRSLPARTSMVSLASTLTTTTSPKPELSDFQLRRRRAAKLTHFFGVDYRDLIKEVLESIEKGVDDEQERGTLNPAEAEDLMQKLRNLKTKRASSW